MGNKVSAEAGVDVKNLSGNANPPPECPMHKKEENKTKTSVSECPVQHGNDINPYNMVNNSLY